MSDKFDVALLKRFTSSPALSAAGVTADDTLIIRNGADGTIYSVTIAALAAALSSVNGPKQTLTLLNSWVNYGGAYSDAYYYKDASGNVHITGLVKSGTVGAAVGYISDITARPAKNVDFPGIANGQFASLRVSPDGYVYVDSATSNAWLSLDGISYRID